MVKDGGTALTRIEAWLEELLAKRRCPEEPDCFPLTFERQLRIVAQADVERELNRMCNMNISLTAPAMVRGWVEEIKAAGIDVSEYGPFLPLHEKVYLARLEVKISNEINYHKRYPGAWDLDPEKTREGIRIAKEAGMSAELIRRFERQLPLMDKKYAIARAGKFVRQWPGRSNETGEPISCQQVYELIANAWKLPLSKVERKRLKDLTRGFAKKRMGRMEKAFLRGEYSIPETKKIIAEVRARGIDAGPLERLLPLMEADQAIQSRKSGVVDGLGWLEANVPLHLREERAREEILQEDAQRLKQAEKEIASIKREGIPVADLETRARKLAEMIRGVCPGI